MLEKSNPLEFDKEGLKLSPHGSVTAFELFSLIPGTSNDKLHYSLLNRCENHLNGLEKLEKTLVQTIDQSSEIAEFSKEDIKRIACDKLKEFSSMKQEIPLVKSVSTRICGSPKRVMLGTNILFVIMSLSLYSAYPEYNKTKI